MFKNKIEFVIAHVKWALFLCFFSLFFGCSVQKTNIDTTQAQSNLKKTSSSKMGSFFRIAIFGYDMQSDSLFDPYQDNESASEFMYDEYNDDRD